jgi:hypothetical protein
VGVDRAPVSLETASRLTVPLRPPKRRVPASGILRGFEGLGDEQLDAPVGAVSLRLGIEQRGVEAWGTRRFFVRDPNGVVVNVVGHPDSLASSG